MQAHKPKPRVHRLYLSPQSTNSAEMLYNDQLQDLDKGPSSKQKLCACTQAHKPKPNVHGLYLSPGSNNLSEIWYTDHLQGLDKGPRFKQILCACTQAQSPNLACTVYISAPNQQIQLKFVILISFSTQMIQLGSLSVRQHTRQLSTGTRYRHVLYSFGKGQIAHEDPTIKNLYFN